MLVFYPTDNPAIRGKLIEIDVLWEDDTHVLGERVRPGTSGKRYLIEKADVPTEDQVNSVYAEHFRDLIIERLRPSSPQQPLKLETLRAIHEMIQKEEQK